MSSPKKPVAGVYASYPKEMREKALALRELVFEVARKNSDVGELEETLKWGEPSYIAKQGSTLRIAWKKKAPTHYALYFNCNTILVDTFMEVYPENFRYEGNRAMVFHAEDSVDTAALKHCILLALRYHRLKHLPLLGV